LSKPIDKSVCAFILLFLQCVKRGFMIIDVNPYLFLDEDLS